MRKPPARGGNLGTETDFEAPTHLTTPVSGPRDQGRRRVFSGNYILRGGFLTHEGKHEELWERLVSGHVTEVFVFGVADGSTLGTYLPQTLGLEPIVCDAYRYFPEKLVIITEPLQIRTLHKVRALPAQRQAPGASFAEEPGT